MRNEDAETDRGDEEQSFADEEPPAGAIEEPPPATVDRRADLAIAVAARSWASSSSISPAASGTESCRTPSVRLASPWCSAG